MIKHNSPVVWQWWSAFSFSLFVCSDIKVTVWHGSLFFLRKSMKTQLNQSNILWQKELIRMCKEHKYNNKIQHYQCYHNLHYYCVYITSVHWPLSAFFSILSFVFASLMSSPEFVNSSYLYWTNYFICSTLLLQKTATKKPTNSEEKLESCVYIFLRLMCVHHKLPWWFKGTFYHFKHDLANP